MVLENLLPMGENSMSRSMSSITMQALLVRYASQNTLVMLRIFSPSVIPTRFSGEMIFRQVKLPSREKVIAIMVFPVPGRPLSSTDRLGLDCSPITAVSCRLFMMRSKLAPQLITFSLKYPPNFYSSTPNCGFTSYSARKKSCRYTRSAFSSITSSFENSRMLVVRLMEWEEAHLTSASISAPVKFLVILASSSILQSGPSRLLVLKSLVWMRRICSLPSVLGRFTSMCTSNLPGLSTASSSKSLRLVMPMTTMLLSASTPSILVSSWLTTWSLTCAPTPPCMPLCLQMASISSNTMMCSGLLSPSFCSSALASANSFLMFSSDSPTNLLKISGPLTILRSLTLRALASCRAMRVLPVPGGPQSKIPFTCLMPNRLMVDVEYLLDAKVLRKMLNNYSSSPPIPMSYMLKSGRKMFFQLLWVEEMAMSDPAGTLSSTCVSGSSLPKEFSCLELSPVSMTRHLTAFTLQMMLSMGTYLLSPTLKKLFFSLSLNCSRMVKSYTFTLPVNLGDTWFSYSYRKDKPVSSQNSALNGSTFTALPTSVDRNSLKLLLIAMVDLSSSGRKEHLRILPPMRTLTVLLGFLARVAEMKTELFLASSLERLLTVRFIQSELILQSGYGIRGSLRPTFLLEVHELIPHPRRELREGALLGLRLAQQVVVSIVLQLHKVVRSCPFLSPRVQLELDAAGEGHRLGAVAHHRLVLELSLQALGIGEVEEGEHGGDVGIVAAVYGYFPSLCPCNPTLHVLKDSRSEGSAQYLRKMPVEQQHEHIILYELHLQKLRLREPGRHRPAEVQIAHHHVIELNHPPDVVESGGQVEHLSNPFREKGLLLLHDRSWHCDQPHPLSDNEGFIRAVSENSRFS